MALDDRRAHFIVQRKAWCSHGAVAVQVFHNHCINPRNGMALCKNHHWAMDQFLIAPGTDHHWHVSKKLDDRVEGQQDLLQLKDRTILLPSDSRYHPRPDSLEWRTERLLSGKN